jgi:hypothetical protein
MPLSRTHEALLPLNIDSTMISCFRSCGQKFYEEFVLGLRPSAVSVDLHTGACFASAMENIYTDLGEGLDLERAKVRAFGKYMDQWGNFESMKDTPKTRERVWEAVDEYFRMWPPKTDPVQPYKPVGSNEFTFAIPLEPITDTPAEGGFPAHPSGAPFLYSGRFDLLGRWGTKIVPRDEKTTTSIGANWARQWDLRSQFMGYCWACQQSGLDVDTVCVRGIGILKTKFTLVDAFKTYPQHLIERWLEQVRRDLWRIRRSWDEGYWDYNLAESCSSYGGCAFLDLCTSPEPDRWRSQFVVRRWNPVLKNPTAEEQ